MEQMRGSGGNAIGALRMCLDLLRSFRELEAVGLSGSPAATASDSSGALEFFAYVREEVPGPKERWHRYESSGFARGLYVDSHFDAGRSDGVLIEGIECAIHWVTSARAREYIESLGSDFEGDEFLAEGLLVTRPLHDPPGLIAELRSRLPEYPEARARHRLGRGIAEAHALLAEHDFVDIEDQALETFVTALFALNRQWYSEAKRLGRRMASLRMTPVDTAERLEALVSHAGPYGQPDVRAQGVRSLFHDLAAISANAFPGLALPTEWG